MPKPGQWVTVHNPKTNGMPHRISADPVVIADFETRGFVLVGDLKGKALDDALDQAGLPKSGSVAEKQALLAEQSATVAAPTTKEN